VLDTLEQWYELALTAKFEGNDEKANASKAAGVAALKLPVGNAMHSRTAEHSTARVPALPSWHSD
jgi:hypothetical protein